MRLPHGIVKRFPGLQKIGVFSFNKNVDIDVVPIKILVAVLPPES